MATKKKTKKKSAGKKKKTSRKVSKKKTAAKKKKKSAAGRKTAKKTTKKTAKKTAKRTARKSALKKKASAAPKKKKAPAKKKQSESPEAVSGRAFPWHEVCTRSPEQAKHFYATVLGWTTSEMDMGNGFKYTMFHHHGVPIAGLMPLTGPEWEGESPHWMTYLRVANCDSATERAVSLGATVKVPPTDIPNNIGRFSVIVDPTGAEVSLYHSDS